MNQGTSDNLNRQPPTSNFKKMSSNIITSNDSLKNKQEVQQQANKYYSNSSLNQFSSGNFDSQPPMVHQLPLGANNLNQNNYGSFRDAGLNINYSSKK